jgi:hypothetical protein
MLTEEIRHELSAATAAYKTNLHLRARQIYHRGRWLHFLRAQR